MHVLLEAQWALGLKSLIGQRICLSPENSLRAASGHMNRCQLGSCRILSTLYPAKIPKLVTGTPTSGTPGLSTLIPLSARRMSKRKSRSSGFRPGLRISRTGVFVYGMYSFQFETGIFLTCNSSKAIESIFVLYRITGDESLRDDAWEIFQTIEHHTATEFGNTALRDVTLLPAPQEDSMAAFWMAETMKYLYLIFSRPEVISLDEYVFNTEGHPFLRPR
jgi:hypothetical protein